MAYAFDKLKGLMDGEQQSTVDVFGDTGGVGVGLGGEQQGADQQSKVKTTTEGDLGASGSGSGEVKSSDSPEMGPVDQSVAITANVGKTETPKGVEGIRYQIDQNKKSLQDKADQYVENYKAEGGIYDYGLDQNYMQQGVKEGPANQAYGDTQGLIAKGAADAAPEFGSIDDLYVNKAKYLDSDAGLQYLASQAQGPRYTQGMSAFDVMLMRRDPNFNRMVNEIKAQNAGLNKDLGERPGQEMETAYQYGTEQLGTAQQGAKDYLSGYWDNLIGQNEQQAADYNAYLQGLDREAIGDQAISDVSQGAKDYLTTYYEGDRYNPQWEGTVDTYDPQSYISYDNPDHVWQDFIDRDESSQFGNIGGMLGTGQNVAESAALDPAYIVDKYGLQGGLQTAVQAARTKADESQLKAIDEILGEASGLAEGEDARVRELIDSYGGDLETLINDIVAAEGWQDDFNQDWVDEYQYQSAQEANPDLYSQDLGAFDYLTEEQAKKLNELGADVGTRNLEKKGLPDEFKAGAKGLGGDFLDESHISEWLEGKVGQERDRKLALAESKRKEEELRRKGEEEAAEKERQNGLLSVFGEKVRIPGANTDDERMLLDIAEVFTSPYNNKLTQAQHAILAKYVPGYQEALDKANKYGGHVEGIVKGYKEKGQKWLEDVAKAKTREFLDNIGGGFTPSIVLNQGSIPSGRIGSVHIPGLSDAGNAASGAWEGVKGGVQDVADEVSSWFG